MSDDRGNGGVEDDGLDAWLAANFPPTAPDSSTGPEEPDGTAGPDEPGEPAVPPTAVPPTAVPPTVVPPTAVPPTVVPPTAVPPTVVPPIIPPGIPPVTPPVQAPPPPEPPPGVQAPPPEPPPTQAMHSPGGAGDHAAFPPMSEELGGVPPAPEFPPAPTEAFSEVSGASGIDALFGETKFRDYEQEPAASENPFVAGGARRGGTATISTAQKALMWVAGSLVALLALLALFTLGTKLTGLLGPAPDVVSAPTTTTTPTPTAPPLGPVAPGEYHWNKLLGGECLSPYPGPWAEDYTVVDCESPHPAQLVTRGSFSEDDGFLTPYPGIEALQAQVNLLCTPPTVIDYAKAKAYTDIQYEASFPASAQEWAEGDRDYFCFLSRASGGMITGTIAQPQVAPTPSPEPTETPAP